MLLEFTVENYRSFYGKKTLVLEADKALKECTETNLFDCNKHTLLRSLALYGAKFKWKIQPCQCDARNGEMRVVVGEVE